MLLIERSYRRRAASSSASYAWPREVIPNVSAKSDQNWNSEDALTYGMTVTAKVDDELGYAVRHLFGGAGWKAQLTKMGFTLGPDPTP